MEAALSVRGDGQTGGDPSSLFLRVGGDIVPEIRFAFETATREDRVREIEAAVRAIEAHPQWCRSCRFG